MPQVKVIIDEHGSVVCDPDRLKVRKSQGSVVIKWKVYSDYDWEIREITDLEGDPLESKTFKDQKKDGRGWKVRDMNDNLNEYPYIVHVQRPSTGECKAHDPVIKNKGRKVS